MNTISKEKPPYFKLLDADMTKIQELNGILERFLGLGLAVKEKEEWYSNFRPRKIAFFADGVYLVPHGIDKVYNGLVSREKLIDKAQDPEWAFPSVIDLVIKELNRHPLIGDGIWLWLPKFRTPAELKMKLELMNADAIAKCIHS